ncbi:MAG: hypothetical protein WC048_04225 [Rhizobium sp.]
MRDPSQEPAGAPTIWSERELVADLLMIIFGSVGLISVLTDRADLVVCGITVTSECQAALCAFVLSHGMACFRRP